MVRAVHLDKEAFHEDASSQPGSFFVDDPDPGGVQILWYRCPCGCGAAGVLRVGNGFKPAIDKPSWSWNGSIEAPTLTPSVHHIGHWHGFLTEGEWRSC
ncbi:DUF6527 family protein [Ensifer sp. LCM 4579]|uniref:DUF6527 family protein n=1 Tax=Ensifer sp. LCM 4579 TaxID=1848292 RepID=UPI0008D9B177|nr:DUF6527 family protein [Ensifer sp. LCM 4579]OHV85966.1 hypothetical protein LCM4579_00970 [Ensifer sp. LCM 4579]